MDAMRNVPRFLVPLLLLVVGVSQASAQLWNQWAGGPQHTGSLPVTGQRFDKELANIIVDPFVAQERAEAGGSLLVHYQTPLSDGKDVFMEVKSGEYTGFRTWETQTWNVRKYEWEGTELIERWTAASDWKPVPSGGPRFEPVFHSAMAHNAIYMAGAGGTVLEVDRDNGTIRRRLGQFGVALDPRTHVSSPITIDGAGNLYYNVLRVAAATNPWTVDIDGAWLVKIAPTGIASRVSYSALVPNAPAPTAGCLGEFSGSSLPWPPSPDAVPASVPCGSQRPGLNVAPAVGPDGTIYTVSRAHLNSRWGWLVAVNPDLSPKWASTMRNRFNDGCNVLLPPNGVRGGCRTGATTGVDPADNQPGSGGVNDNSTSSPVVAPDGTIYYGSYTRYNYSQGHMMRYSASGEFLSSYPFGWDVTPALWEHDGTFSLITKENRYEGVGSYCNTAAFCAGNRIPSTPEGYYLTQLTPSMNVEWQFKSTNTLSCSRRDDGTMECVDDRPGGFEWCVNSLAVDSQGVVYANSEDGHLYSINQGGTLRERIFLQLALGAAYTPLSLGSDGRIYTQNAGRLFVVGAEGGKRRRAVRR
jgi:outer membrane protein assembly factor BamB